LLRSRLLQFFCNETRRGPDHLLSAVSAAAWSACNTPPSRPNSANCSTGSSITTSTFPSPPCLSRGSKASSLGRLVPDAGNEAAGSKTGRVTIWTWHGERRPEEHVMAFKVQVGRPQIAIHQGQTVLVTDPDGSITWPSDKGLYFLDSNFERPRAYSKNVTPKYRPKRQSAGILLPAPVSDTETQRCVRNVRHIAAFRARPDSVCVRDRLSAWGGGIRTSAFQNRNSPIL
jgi:hypothetical protein